jgi:hypothetical protein
VVIIAGAHLDISSTVDARVQAVVILKYFRCLHAVTHLIICSGNYDLDTHNSAGEKVARWMGKVRQLRVPTDGECLTVGDTMLTICPWWDGPQTREVVSVRFAGDAAKPKDTWIWVYHAPPDASPTSWGGQRYFGDAYLTQ